MIFYPLTLSLSPYGGEGTLRSGGAANQPIRSCSLSPLGGEGRGEGRNNRRVQTHFTPTTFSNRSSALSNVARSVA